MIDHQIGIRQNILGRLVNRVTRAIPVKACHINLDAPVASFTFDDFPKNAWTLGGSLVQEFGGRATYYVSGSFCGKVLNGVQYFDEGDLAEIVRSGHDLGCHTYDHCRMPYASASDIDTSIARNRAFVESVTGYARMTSFAYPYGLTSPRVKHQLGARFSACRGIYPGMNCGYTDLSQLNGLCLHLNEVSFEKYIDKCLRQRGWLIFVGHDVSDKPTPFGCTPRLLEAILARLSRAGIEIQTVDSVLRSILSNTKFSAMPTHAMMEATYPALANNWRSQSEQRP